MRTFSKKLQERTGLTRTRFDAARLELKSAGLLRWRATGRPDGIGTPGGGRHSIYTRAIPFPDPPNSAATDG